MNLFNHAGIGENSALMRGLISEGLEWAGLSLDEVKNRETVAQEGDISSGHARVKVGWGRAKWHGGADWEGGGYLS